MYIYVISNSATGKIYVGQHKGTNLRQYLQKKLYDAAKGRGGSSRLYASMRKHPKEVWSIEPLISEIQTREAVDAWEQTLIAMLDTRNPEIGYNICRGGEGFTGKHSESARQKIIENTRRMWERPEIRENFTAKMTGHPVSDETVQKIKAARGGQDESARLAAWRDWERQHPGKVTAHFTRELRSRVGKLGGSAVRGEAKRRAGRLGAAAGMAKAQHTRWHLNRGLLAEWCAFCAPLMVAAR
jgi:hypothetical protein